MKWRYPNLKQRLFPGLLSGMAIALLWLLGVLYPLEQLGYNALFQLRGEQAWDDRVVVIKIDDPSLEALGQFPWNRRQYVPLLTTLSQAGASVVTFDLLWSETSPDDSLLAQAIADHGTVVLAYARNPLGVPLPPVASLQTVATHIGHIEKHQSDYGLDRKIPAYLQDIPALAIATLQAYSLSHDAVPLPDANTDLWVNWLRSSQRIPSYSFVDVVRGRIPSQVFAGKIVLVGVTATGFDPLTMPFDRQSSSGVYLQATLITNLLQQTLLRSLLHTQLLPLLLIGGVGMSAFLYRWRTAIQLGFGVALIAGWIWLSWGALAIYHLWLPVAAPVLLLITTVVSVILYQRLRLNALLQQQIQQLWQAYHLDLVSRFDAAPAIAQALAQEPASMLRALQLATLTEQFGRSHAAQAAIARNLSLGLLAADLDGRVWFCNPVAGDWLMLQIGETLLPHLVPDWISEPQWQSLYQQLKCREQQSWKPPQPIVTLEVQPQHLLATQSTHRWFAFTVEPLFYHRTTVQPDGLLLILEDITDRKQAALIQAELNQRLTDRTTQLELVNQELEAFSYAVSHDLRAPLRRIKGFSHLLLEENTAQLDDMGKEYLHRIQASVQRMNHLVEDLLNLSRIIRLQMQKSTVNLSLLVGDIIQELQQTQPERNATVIIQPNLEVHADLRLLRVALENLLGNAWKYTSRNAMTQIEFGVLTAAEIPAALVAIADLAATAPVFFIRDNGVGFDMAQVDRLFGAFQRLHTEEEFPGNGIGLMTTRRIIHRHQGRIWATAVVGQGATFYFTISNNNDVT